MALFPPDRFGLIHRSTAARLGFDDRRLRNACLDGELVRLTRGVYASADPARTSEDLFRLRSIAAFLTSRKPCVLSHESAAVVHGLPMLTPKLATAHLTVNTPGGCNVSADRHVHVGTLHDDDVTIVAGLPVTTVARTAADVARTTHLGFAGALAVFDAALRTGLTTAELASFLSRSARGSSTARRALQFADPLADNPGESWGRAQIIEAGLPLPRLQHVFRDHVGSFVAATDYDWEGRLVAEFDGLAKYRKHLRPGEDSFDAMRCEKIREDRLRALGVMVIRWTWSDLATQTAVPQLVHHWIRELAIA